METRPSRRCRAPVSGSGGRGRGGRGGWRPGGACREVKGTAAPRQRGSCPGGITLPGWRGSAAASLSPVPSCRGSRAGCGAGCWAAPSLGPLGGADVCGEKRKKTRGGTGKDERRALPWWGAGARRLLQEGAGSRVGARPLPQPYAPSSRGEAVRFLSMGLDSAREAINPYGSKFSNHVPPQLYSVIPDAQQFVLIRL